MVFDHLLTQNLGGLYRLLRELASVLIPLLGLGDESVCFGDLLLTWPH